MNQVWDKNKKITLVSMVFATWMKTSVLHMSVQVHLKLII